MKYLLLILLLPSVAEGRQSGRIMVRFVYPQKTEIKHTHKRYVIKKVNNKELLAKIEHREQEAFLEKVREYQSKTKLDPKKDQYKQYQELKKKAKDNPLLTDYLKRNDQFYSWRQSNPKKKVSKEEDQKKQSEVMTNILRNHLKKKHKKKEVVDEDD